MSTDSTKSDLQQWLLKEWISGLCQSIESMTGERPAISDGAAAFDPEEDCLIWSETLSLGPDCSIAVAFPQAAWTAAGRGALIAIGLDDPDDASIRGTFLETIRQAIAVAVRAIGARLGRDVTSTAASELEQSPFPLLRVDGNTSGQEIPHGFGASPALLQALTPRASSQKAATEGANPHDTTSSFSKTLDLLLDVELPVSVSFGRAKVPLKEVLKLTSGSIVELNRTISEPVEVIVNNCVIARGEVVVVEGNYGIRINQIVSREERLRTLN